MYDLIIIGAGPAGITAGIYAARKKMETLVVSKDLGGQTNWVAGIENYTGYQFITGNELVQRFKDHLKQFKDLEIREGEAVSEIRKEGEIVRVTAGANTYEAKAAVIASGRSHRRLGVPGEEAFTGKGVAYCATCDAPLFVDMAVAVVGGGNSGLEATVQLMKVARKIYVIDVEQRFRADPVIVEKVERSENVVAYHGARVTEIRGGKFVTGITLEHNGERRDIDVEGVFVEVGSAASTDFAGIVAKNPFGEIIVNCKCETNIPGIFAAGDATNVPAKQVIVACGEGAKAAVSAFDYITKSSEKRFVHATQ